MRKYTHKSIYALTPSTDVGSESTMVSRRFFPMRYYKWVNIEISLFESNRVDGGVNPPRVQ